MSDTNETFEAELDRHEADKNESGNLRNAITRAIEASDNDGGSAGDAIQDMLCILREALQPVESALHSADYGAGYSAAARGQAAKDDASADWYEGYFTCARDMESTR